MKGDIIILIYEDIISFILYNEFQTKAMTMNYLYYFYYLRRLYNKDHVFWLQY